MASKNTAGSVRAFGQTSGADVDTSGLGGNSFVSATKMQGQPLHVLRWRFGESKFGPCCYVDLLTKDVLGESTEVTLVLSDKSPAYYQLQQMDEAGDDGEFMGTLIPQGKSFEWA